MYIISANCWKCKQPMNVALIRTTDYDKRGATTVGPKFFSEEELHTAVLEGVYIKNQYSNTANESYSANTCQKCGSFIGEHFLFTDYLNPAELGDYTYKRIEL